MIHKYTLFGYNIVLDVESGAVHILSDVAMDMLDDFEKMTKKNNFESSEMQEAYAELRELYENNLLFSKPVDVGRDAPGAPGILAIEKIPIKALCLNISHDCNMACEYCFAGKGDATTKGRYGLEKKLMSEETGMNAIQFLMRNSKSRKNLEVDFFGGEPLMNFDVVKNIVLNTRKLEKEYINERSSFPNVRFTLTTNGTLLDDEKINFINENISNIVLSLDGEKLTNDNMRKYNGGEGIYSEVVPLYQKLVADRKNKSYKDYYIRGTFTRKNLDFAKDVIHMGELGFENISVEPVVAEENNDYAIRQEDLPTIFKEYETLANEIIKREQNQKNMFNFFHFNIDLENGPCVYKRSKGCGSGSEYLAITPNGDIYPCHQFVGNEKYNLGNVNTPDIKLNRDLMKNFHGNNIVSNECCNKCWAKYFCGGGCAANNDKFNDNIYSPYEIACEMEKKRVECAIAIKAALSL
jgi:uncharacterized protein